MAATKKIRYPDERAKPVKPKRPPDEANLARDLRAVMRRHLARVAAAEESEGERDRVIRDAHAAGMSTKRIAEETGLSPARIDQIRRGGRL